MSLSSLCDGTPCFVASFSAMNILFIDIALSPVVSSCDTLRISPFSARKSTFTANGQSVATIVCKDWEGKGLCPAVVAVLPGVRTIISCNKRAEKVGLVAVLRSFGDVAPRITIEPLSTKTLLATHPPCAPARQ